MSPTSTARLGVVLTPAGGLFADEYTYDNVIDANVRNGTFDPCVIGGAYAGSLFLGVECDYDEGANVDLTITRTAFDDVAGLNANGAAVGFGLECIYDLGLTGGIAEVLGDLFLFTDPVNYNTALNQLVGLGLCQLPAVVPEPGCPSQRHPREGHGLRGSGIGWLGARVPRVLADPHLGPGRLSVAQGRWRHRGGHDEVAPGLGGGRARRHGRRRRDHRRLGGLRHQPCEGQAVRRQCRCRWPSGWRLCGLRSGHLLPEGHDHLQLVRWRQRPQHQLRRSCRRGDVRGQPAG